MALAQKTKDRVVAALADRHAADEVIDRLDQIAADPGAALTAQDTTITIADAAGTPEFTMASFTNSSAWGFAAEDEIITFAYVVRNLQVRLAEVEARLEAHGIIASN